MNNRKDDSYYVSKAIENIDSILAYIKGKSRDDFMNDELLNDAIMFRLIQLAENVGRLTPEFKASHSDIPWGLIAGFRNGIVHDYGKTDHAVVYEIITRDLRDLRENLTEIGRAK